MFVLLQNCGFLLILQFLLYYLDFDDFMQEFSLGQARRLCLYSYLAGLCEDKRMDNMYVCIHCTGPNYIGFHWQDIHNSFFVFLLYTFVDI